MKPIDCNGDYVGVLHLLLLQSGKYSFVPELHNIVGDDLMIKILEIFGGVTMKFPSDDEISMIARDIDVYRRLEKVPDGKKASPIADLASTYDTCDENVIAIYNRVHKNLSKLGIRFV